jgi:uncharacterized protein (DUF302 family)
VTQRTRYGIGTTVGLPYKTAVERVGDELSREGFGILTEIDVAATLTEELNVDYRPYLILGACDPPP